LDNAAATTRRNTAGIVCATSKSIIAAAGSDSRTPNIPHPTRRSSTDDDLGAELG